MKNRISYYVSRKSVLTWIVSILLVLSAACRIAFFCEGKDADASTVWFTLILPLLAGVWFGLILLLRGEERLYRTSIPVAIWFACLAVQITPSIDSAWFHVLVWILAIVLLTVYHITLTGKIRFRWILVMILLAVTGTEIWLYRENVFTQFDVYELTGYAARIALSLAVLLTVTFMQPHLDDRYHPVWGDRTDGRRLRSISPMAYVSPFMMPNRSGAQVSFQSSVEITNVEKYIHAKRRDGMTNFGIQHVFLAAYVRTVASYPAMNRFLSGQRVYSRDEDIQFCMTIKKDMTLEAPDTEIKLHLAPTDTAADCYEKFNRAVAEVKNTPLDSSFDKTAHALMLIPGVLLKFAIWLLKLIDYFGLLPAFLLEVSPFHGSIFFTSMGSLGIPPVVHHLYDFGNLPVFVAFGRKRRASEITADGEIVSHRYVDYTDNIDERIVDGFYYAKALKHFERLLRHPEQLDEKPDRVLRDID